MKTNYCIAAAAALAAVCVVGVSAARAQVTVLAHNGAPAATVSWSNAPDTWDRALRDANQRGGNYRSLLQSEVPGYGAVQCFTHAGRSYYFVAEGHGSAAAADRQAFSYAQRQAPQGVTIALCANWNNQNRYALQRGY